MTATLAAAPNEQLTQLAGLASDPVRFARGLLCHDPWPTQEAILRAVARHPRVAVKACHASSKTFTAAEAVLWWVTRYPDGVVITTAPTFTQVERLLWGEVHKAAGTSRVEFPKLNKTELPISADNYAFGLSTNEGVRFQGFHGRVLIVLDEAPGILPDIFDAIEGIRAGGHVHVLMLGNPIVGAGPFYDAFAPNASRWERFTISAFDTPNLAGVSFLDETTGTRYGDPKGKPLLSLTEKELDWSPRPYLVTRRWVREKAEEWTPESPLWESKVLGQFPRQSEDALISLAWLEAARLPKSTSGELEAGVDVAGPGEAETVLCVRDGPAILKLKAWSTRDSRGDVASELQPFKGRKIKVKVDSVGMGFYFAQHFRDLGYDVVEVNVGEPARDTEKYANLKAELYWGLRQRFSSGAVGGLTDMTAMAQLSTVRYKHNSRGQVVIESKDDAQKRGVPSPDRAEAVMLAFAPPPPDYRQDLNPKHWKRARIG